MLVNTPCKWLMVSTYILDPLTSIFARNLGPFVRKMHFVHRPIFARNLGYKTIKKISSHEHYRQGGPIDLYFKVAQEMGIEKAVFVHTGMGPDNRGYLTHMQELLEVQKNIRIR
jgi:hypothetical protein